MPKKKYFAPDSYAVSRILIKVVVIVATALFIVWAVRFVPPIIHLVY